MLGFLSTVVAGGHYGDKRGKLPVMVFGSVMMAGGALLFVWMDNFAGAMFAMFIMGAGGGFAEGVAMAILADLYWGARRTAMLNGAQVVFGFGAVGAPLAVARLLKIGVDWRSGYTGAGAVCLFAALLAFAAFKTGKERPVADHQSSTDGLRELLSDRLIFWLSMGILLYVAAEAGQVNWMAAFFKRDLGASAPLAASSVALFWAGITCGRLTGAWLSQRMADVTLILLFLCVATFLQMVLLLSQSPVVAMVVVFALGFFMGPVWPTILSRASAARPERSGLLFGVIMSFGCIGAAVFPPFMGKASDIVGMRAALWMCFALLLANLCIFVMLRIREASAQRAVSASVVDTAPGGL